MNMGFEGSRPKPSAQLDQMHLGLAADVKTVVAEFQSSRSVMFSSLCVQSCLTGNATQTVAY